MSYQSQNRENQRGAESGHAVVTVLIVIIVGALGFIAGRMIPTANLPGPLAQISPAGASFASALTPAASQPVSADNPLVARISGQDVTKADLQETIKNLPENYRQFPEEVLTQFALDQMIGERVIDAKIGNSGLESDPEVQQQLANAQKQIVRSIFIEREVKKAVTEDKIKKAYEDYKANFPKVEEVKASHILVSAEDEQKAKDLIKQLDGGADFAKLAKENSLDGSSETGGDLGYFAKEEVVPEFAKAAFETKVGAYTKAPVKSSFGFHIIKVEDKRERPAADFETAKPYLEQEIGRQLYNDIIAQWREDAKVERFDEKGNVIPDQPMDQAEGVEPDAGEHEAVEPATGSEEGQEPSADAPAAAESAPAPAEGAASSEAPATDAAPSEESAPE